MASIASVLAGTPTPKSVRRRHPRLSKIVRRLSHPEPGWPLTGMLIGFPLWWVIGLAGVVPLIAAAIMAVQLLHRPGPLHVRRGFGWWLLFLAWVAVGVLLLQVSAPHAIADHSNTRYLTFAFRFAWYVAATITMIYVYNMRDQLSTTKIMRAFGWLFITVVCGGFLGTLAANVDFPSLFELVLPSRVAHIQYVHDLIHPVLAQRYTVDGVANPRASAPFAYTNDWGLNFACLLPFFVVGWVRDATGWRRRVGIFVLLASVYPAVMAQNRGMWLALVSVALLIAVRSALFGRMRTIAGVALLAVVLGAVLVSTPLGDTIMNRLGNGYSNAGRESLGTLTVESVTSKSPVVGLGSTRNVEGSFYSIAGGNTAACGLCTPPALGTQGHFWLLIYSTGIGGILLYLWFICTNLIRSARRYSVIATVTLTVLTVHLVTMFVYDAIGVELVTIFAAIGLLWRDLAESPSGRAEIQTEPSRDRTLDFYGTIVRTNAALFVVLAVVGAGAGWLYDHRQPRTVVAETSIAVPPNSLYPTQEQFSQSMDTIAGLLDSTHVRDAVSSAVGVPADDVPDHLSISATANTRILHVRYSDTSKARAVSASLVAAKQLIFERSTLLRELRVQSLNALSDRRAGLVASITTLSREQESTDDLVDLLSGVDAQYLRVENSSTTGGTVVMQPVVLARARGWLVDAASGAAIGVLIATVIAYTRRLFGVRVGHVRRRRVLDDLWILDRVAHPRQPSDSPEGAVGRRLDSTAAALAATGTTHVVGAGADVEPLVDSLQNRLAPFPRGSQGGVAVVARASTRVHDVTLVRERIERSGLPVTGLIIRVSESKDPSLLADSVRISSDVRRE